MTRINGDPLVSVCVQTYQHASYINQCLDGILRQETNFEFEVLVGEDASTDGTREICIDYAQRYPDQIRLFQHDRKNVIYINDRPTGRYNVLNNFREAKGKYLAFCEGDDFWDDPTKLQQQFDFLENNSEFVLCYHNVRLANSDGTLREQWKTDPDRIGKGNPDLFFSRVDIPLLASMWRRSAMPNHYPKEFYSVFNGDTLVLGTLACSGPGKHLHSIRDAIARVHAGGIWSTKSSLEQSLISIDTFTQMLNLIDSKFQEEIISRIEREYHTLLSVQIKRCSPKGYATTWKDLHAFLGQHRRSVTRSLMGHLSRVLGGPLRCVTRTVPKN